MTATIAPVVSLEAHRLSRPPACGCARHTLEALTSRAVHELAGTEGELLVSRDLVVDLVDDLVRTVDAALKWSRGETTP
jgi:hypothetical protein